MPAGRLLIKAALLSCLPGEGGSRSFNFWVVSLVPKRTKVAPHYETEPYISYIWGLLLTHAFGSHLLHLRLTAPGVHYLLFKPVVQWHSYKGVEESVLEGGMQRTPVLRSPSRWGVPNGAPL